jgi:purine/pyrimidine-nucleoside phosphorylase
MLKHNTYFEGKVQSVGFERNGFKATVGVIAPGEYHFNTAAAERMTVTCAPRWRVASGLPIPPEPILKWPLIAALM